jgi:hypothetical protein
VQRLLVVEWQFGVLACASSGNSIPRILMTTMKKSNAFQAFLKYGRIPICRDQAQFMGQVVQL